MLVWVVCVWHHGILLVKMLPGLRGVSLEVFLITSTLFLHQGHFICFFCSKKHVLLYALLWLLWLSKMVHLSCAASYIASFKWMGVMSTLHLCKSICHAYADCVCPVKFCVTGMKQDFLQLIQQSLLNHTPL